MSSFSPNQFAHRAGFSHGLPVNPASQTTTLRCVRTLLFALSCTVLCASGRGAHYARGQLIPEVRLKNGVMLHAVTIVAVGSTTVVARWDGGQGSILLTQLPDDLRTELAPVVAVKPAPAPEPTPPSVAVDPKLASAELPSEIKLTNGFIMHQSKVTRWEPDSVLVSYQGGIVSVRWKNIVPEQRVIFEARKDEALARQAKEDAAAGSGQVTAARDDQNRQADEAHAAEEAEKKAEEIRNGVSFHYLVKGMNKAEVKQAFGKPIDDHGDNFLYPSRGHDKYGNSADRTLGFKDGLLTSWRDARDQEPDGAVEH